MKVALAHDWLTGMRGGEKVLEQLALMHPGAPIYTLVHEPGSVSELIEQHEIRPSLIQRLPARSAYRWYLPIFPLAIRLLKTEPVDVMISSSHCAAKAIITGPQTLHLCYCHTPMRYAWDQFDTYFSAQRQGHVRFAVIRSIIPWLRRWDRATASRVDAFAANSRYVAERIEHYYGRGAVVIPPPVDTDTFVPSGSAPDDHWLMVTALSPYKRLDIAIEAFNRTGRKLVIVGWGPEEHRLRQLAGPSVQFVGKVDNSTLLHLYQSCRGLLLPGVEDAGIAPLEAMACGRPALVLNRGGAPEAVIDGETGLHIAAATSAAINSAVDTAEGLKFNTGRVRAHAQRYAPAVFRQRVQEFTERALTARRRGAAIEPDIGPATTRPPATGKSS